MNYMFKIMIILGILCLSAGIMFAKVTPGLIFLGMILSFLGLMSVFLGFSFWRKYK